MSLPLNSCVGSNKLGPWLRGAEVELLSNFQVCCRDSCQRADKPFCQGTSVKDSSRTFLQMVLIAGYARHDCSQTIYGFELRSKISRSAAWGLVCTLKMTSLFWAPLGFHSLTPESPSSLRENFICGWVARFFLWGDMSMWPILPSWWHPLNIFFKDVDVGSKLILKIK